MKLNLLFVDDEPKILNGLRRSIRSMHHEWNMDFAEGASEALQKMEDVDYDAIVSDLRMPHIDGAEFLDKARTLQPHTIRMVLSGHADMDMATRSTNSAHRFLAKPCSPEDLTKNLNAALKLRGKYNSPTMRQMATASKLLPAAPKLFQALTEMLKQESTSIEDVAALVSNDASMASSVLKLASSSFFSVSSSMDNIEKAVLLLGIDVIRNLVLVNEIIQCYDSNDLKWLDLEGLWNQSFLSANVAKCFALNCAAQKHIQDQAQTAGILQNIGVLVMAQSLGKEYQEVYEASIVNSELDSSRVLDFSELNGLECEHFGFTHNQLTAYMLELWNVSDAIVEAACFNCSSFGDGGSLPQKFLFMANEVLAHLMFAKPVSPDVLQYISELGQSVETLIGLANGRINS